MMTLHRFRIAKLLTLTATIMALLATASPVYAAGTIGGRPANPDAANPRTKSIFIRTIEPGASVRDAVEVVNGSNATKQVRVYATDSVRSSGGAFACAQAAETPRSVGSWISPNTTDITVPANKTVRVDFTITAPATASVGEQNGCIVIQEQADPTFQGGIGINFRTAIRVAVLVPGTVVKKLTATGIQVTEKDDTIVITPKAQNQGNVSLDTVVTTELHNLAGVRVSQSNNTFPVLRGEQAEWNIETNKPFWGGFYQASYDLSFDASDNFIDSASSTARRQTVEGSSKLFFVTPAPAAVLAELAIAASIAGLIGLFVVRRSRRKLTDRTWVNYTVKKGDNIQSVAKDRAITWKALARNNGIAAPYLLTPGMTIKVPALK